MMSTLNRHAPRGLAAAVLFSALGAAPVARAGADQDRWAAHQQLTQAQDLKKKGQLQEALTHYEESLRLDPKLATMIELAELEEQLGKLVEARAHWTAARDKAQQVGAGTSKQRAEDRLAALEKRQPHLTLQLAADAPADAQVLLDDVPLDKATIGAALALNPGEHAVVVKAVGHEDAKYAVKLAEGDNQTLPIAVTPKAAPPPPPPPPPKPAPPPKPVESVNVSTSSGSTRRTLGIVAGSVGVVGIGVGAGFWSVGWRDRTTLGPSADQNLLIGQIGVIGGAALLATGIVLYVTAPSGEAKTGRLPVVPTLSVAGDGTVLGAAGAF
jgi:hypothetical protein